MERKSSPAIALAALLAACMLLTLLFGAWLWDLAPIRALQAVGSWLTPLMTAVTGLGAEQFYLILIPLFYWCIDKAAGADMGVLLVGSAFANGAVKALFKHARPYWSDPQLGLSSATSFSLPSGHAQNAAAFGGYLIWLVSGRGRQGRPAPGRPPLWRRATAAGLSILIVLVGLSRAYLGVHYPGDVLWGWTAGLLLAYGYIRLRPRAAPWLRGLPAFAHVVLALAAGAVPLLLAFAGLAVPLGAGARFGVTFKEAGAATLAEAANLSGMVAGLWLGLWLEGRSVRFSVAGSARQRILRYALGILGLLLVWMGLRLVFPQVPPALDLALRAVRYGLAMFWAIVVWPWLFVRLGLAAAEPTQPRRLQPEASAMGRLT